MSHKVHGPRGMRKFFLSPFQILFEQAYVEIFFQQEKHKINGILMNCGRDIRKLWWKFN
jgi:hypothetical protein